MTAFFDSNILVYTLSDGDPRQDKAIDLVAGGGRISVQVLNECTFVARRKLRMTWTNIDTTLRSIRTLLQMPSPITMATHQAALRLAVRYGFVFYDALIVAAALECGCDTLLSEDMQDGMRIDESLVIRNPFR